MFKTSKETPAAPLSSSGASSGASSLSEKYSIFELNKIYEILNSNKVITRENYTQVIESLRVLTEMVIYGDSKSQMLFDFFCEKNILILFLSILETPVRNSYKDKEMLLARYYMRTEEEREKDRQEEMDSDEISIEIMVEVYVQILQTLSILVSCVKNDTSLYYLLSNNVINSIISFTFLTQDTEENGKPSITSPLPGLTSPPTSLASSTSYFQHLKLINSYPESLLSHYASFLKTLSLRLNEHTIQFFFNESTGEYPLLVIALTLLENNETMIRISAQTVILNIYRVSTEINYQYNSDSTSDLNFLTASATETGGNSEDLEDSENTFSSKATEEEDENKKTKNPHLFISSASEYAVQEWVLHMMMKIFVRVMMDYFAQLQVLSIEYFNISVRLEGLRTKQKDSLPVDHHHIVSQSHTISLTGEEKHMDKPGSPATEAELEEELLKYENELKIMRNNMEDWLYFLKDLLLMNNKKLVNAITVYLFSHFICLILLDSLVNSYNCLERFTDHQRVYQEREAADSKDPEEAANSTSGGLFNEPQRKVEYETAISHVSCTTYYLFIIVKILNTQDLSLAVLNAITHPLQRGNYLSILNSLDETEEGATSTPSSPRSPYSPSSPSSPSSPCSPSKASADPSSWKENPYRKAFLFFINFPNSKVNLISNLIFSTLANTFCESSYLSSLVEELNGAQRDLPLEETQKRLKFQKAHTTSLYELFQSTFLISNELSTLPSTSKGPSLGSSNSHSSLSLYNTSSTNREIVIIGRQKTKITLKKELSKTVFNTNVLSLNQIIRAHFTTILGHLHASSEDEEEKQKKGRFLKGFLEQLTDFLINPVGDFFSSRSASLPSLFSLQFYSTINFSLSKAFSNTLLFLKAHTNTLSSFQRSDFFVAPFTKISFSNIKKTYYFLSNSFSSTAAILQKNIHIISSELIKIIRMIGNKLVIASRTSSQGSNNGSEANHSSSSSTTSIVSNIISLLLHTNEESYKYSLSKPKVWQSSLNNSTSLIFPSLSNNFNGGYDSLIQSYHDELHVIQKFYTSLADTNELIFVTYDSIQKIFIYLLNAFYLLKNIYVKYERMANLTTQIFEQETRELEKSEGRPASPSSEFFVDYRQQRDLFDASRVTDFFKAFHSPQENPLCLLDEIAMIPPYYQYDSIIAMKGRKFLDIHLIHTKKAPEPGPAPAPSSSTSSSWFSSLMSTSQKRPQSMGTQASASNATPSKRMSLGISSSTPPQPDKNLKLLFLQDSNNLILVGQKKVEGKIIFRVLFSTSLLFCSSSLLPNDKKSCRVTVFTYLNSDQSTASLLYQYGTLLQEDVLGSLDRSSFSCHPQLEELQPANRKVKQFEIILQFETPQAAALATVHIESKKKSISLNYLNNTLLSLEKWKDLTAASDPAAPQSSSEEI